MDISLIMALIFCMEICVHITEICLEGIASQILIEDLVLILWYAEEVSLKRNRKIIKVTRFRYKIETRA